MSTLRRAAKRENRCAKRRHVADNYLNIIISGAGHRYTLIYIIGIIIIYTRP